CARKGYGGSRSYWYFDFW
nr:immunoglobulin heavy chain junction region [Macaca mulatta]